MGRDEHKTGSHGDRGLSQTPKNLKIPADSVNEEYARELAEITRLRNKRLGKAGHSEKS
ncbi:hypothetical protein RG959_06490 [Domibacillus sp. 8LH]|jgi:hypothetical protein|uniref:YfhD family protein n=1 Tax=Domibacillus TaxID=1433999 RepID=UPI001F5A436C|nr:MULTISPECIES: hypothetical protein [Domibacillus]MCI2253378.1 hypothetical protein [Domibacillus sp. PGB-M46]MCM3787836.1 hypothetical protein [Domibacillus indicus]WNS79979.1 hypothetical protein RRU94_20950 [Domibacillus sp. DTU_2020_1001157_1_SI_ALB_TIR_016]